MCECGISAKHVTRLTQTKPPQFNQSKITEQTEITNLHAM